MLGILFQLLYLTMTAAMQLAMMIGKIVGKLIAFLVPMAWRALQKYRKSGKPPPASNAAAAEPVSVPLAGKPSAIQTLPRQKPNAVARFRPRPDFHPRAIRSKAKS